MPQLRTGAVLAVLLVALPSLVHAQPEDGETLNGAWLIEQAVMSEGDTVRNVQPGLFIFTDTHYSIMVVPDTAPRAVFGEDPTDAERLEAFDNFIANSGRYEVQAEQMTIRPYVAKSPNFMADFPDNAATTTFRVEGDRLHWQFPDGPMLILSKVEGRPAP